MTARAKRLDFIDLLKFILSIAVVAIHINPFDAFGAWLNPLLRMSVPLFFLITAYFFFNGYVECTNTEERISKLERYIKRNLQLYFFWLAVLFIPSALYYKWFEGGAIKGLYLLSHSFLHGSTFRASWFIMACVIAAVIIAVESRYLRNWQMIALAIIPYAACCLLSNYANQPFIAARRDALWLLFDGGYTSFWAALLWFALGKWLADVHAAAAQLSKSALVCASSIGLVILCCENYLVVTNAWCQERADCYFSLPLACVPLFLLAQRIHVKVPHVRALRAMSTVTYCLHLSALFVFQNWLVVPFGPRKLLVLVLGVCWGASLAIKHLEKLPHLHWLRFAH